MKSGKKERHVVPVILCALVLAGAAGAGYYYFWKEEASASGSTMPTAYKTEKVARGTVAVSIDENGTITYGTSEQDLELETASASDSSSGSTSSGTASSGGSASSSSGAAQTAAMTFSGTAGAGASSGSAGMASSGMISGGTSGSSLGLKVEQVNVSVGQVVEKGDTLYTISQDSLSDYRENLENAISTAQITVSQEEINAETKKTTAEYTYNMYIAQGESAQETYDATIASLQKAVDDAQKAVDESAEKIETYQNYVDSGYDYDDELEEEQENYESLQDALTLAKNSQTTGTIQAQETLQSAQTNYKYAKQLYDIDTNGLEDDLNEAKDALEDAQAALTAFDETFGSGEITSEYAGTVMSLSYEAGDELVNNAALATFSNAEDVTISISVTQDDISNISVGDTASVSLDAYPTRTYTGKVTGIETAASMGSSTVNYTVTITLDGDVSGIYSGMTGEASFGIESADDVLYISNRAVRQDGTRIYVIVMDADGNMSEKDVETGFSNGKYVEVISGLEEGQTVVISQDA